MTSVHIASEATAEETLDRVLERAGFLDLVEGALQESGKPRKSFAVAVKPNLISSLPSDPALVERLLTQLRERGFETLSVVESGGDVQEAAEAAGYSGAGYRLADLGDEEVQFDYGSVLGQAPAGRSWLEADYRISFGKGKTHRACFYSGCLANLWGCVPGAESLAAHPAEICVLVADRQPVDFALLDVWQVGEIMAGESAFAVDWVAGEKMGLEPALNPVMQEALHRWGRIEISRRGNVSPWRPWRNVRPIVVVAHELLGGRRRRWSVQ